MNTLAKLLFILGGISVSANILMPTAIADNTTVGTRAAIALRATKTTISLDKSSATGGDNQCSTVTTTSKAEGPALTEATAGQLAIGTYVYLKAPTGFEFCSPSGTTTAVVSKGGAASTNLTLDDGSTDGTVAVEPTLTGGNTLTVTIKTASSGSGVANIWFRGVSVRPTGIVPISSAQIKIGYTGGSDANAFELATVAGVAYSAEFVTQPVATSVGVGSPFTTQPTVKVKDRFGNERIGDAVTLSLVGGTAGAALSCTANPVTTTSSGASFAGCKVNMPGIGFTLVASSGAASTVSNSFGVVAMIVSSGNVNSISLDNSSAAGGGNACTPLTSAVVVTETSAGNLVAGRTLTLTLPAGFAFCSDAFATVSSTSSAVTGLTLSQSVATLSTDLTTLTTTIATTSTGTVPGKVTFSGAFVKPTGTVPVSGTLGVGGTAGVSGTSDTIRSTVGSVSQVLFSQLPTGGGAGAGSVLGTQPIVVAKDRFGNVRSGDSFVLTIESGPAGASLGCTSNTTISLGSGASYATFSGCSVDRSGTYRLRAAVSTAFTISSEFTIGAVAPTGAVVKASTDVNAASYISGNSKASVSVDVTFPTGGPRESGVVTVTLASGGSSAVGTASVTSAMTSVTVSGINAASLPDGTITVSASFTGGATSATVSGTPATKDTVAPTLNSSLPTSTVVFRLATASDSGTYDDGVTNVTAPSFTVSNVIDGIGNTGSTPSGIDIVYVQVKLTSSSTYAISGLGVTSATGGIYTVTTATLAEGTYDVQARVVDKAGNSATFPLSKLNGAPSTLRIDTTAPTATVKFTDYADGGVVPNVDSTYVTALPAAVNGTKTVAVQVTFTEAGLSGSPTFTFRTANGVATSVVASESGPGTGIWRESFDVGSSTADGSVTLSMAGVTDAAGNAAVFASGQTTTFAVDNTGPLFSVGYSRASPMGGGSVTITVTSNEALQANPTVVLTKGVATSTFPVSLVSGSTTQWSSSYLVPSSGGDGTVTVAVTGTDLAGNDGNQVVAGGSFVIDTAAPTAATVTQTSADTGFSSADGITTAAPVFQVKVDADATANVAVSKDGTPFALQAGLATIVGTGNAATWTPKGAGGAALTNGTYVFTFTVSDGAGNMAGSSTSKTITLDLEPPVVTVATPTIGAIGEEYRRELFAVATDLGSVDAVTFELRASSTIDFLAVGQGTLEAGSVTSGTWSYLTLPLAKGEWEVRAVARDLAGNMAASPVVRFVVEAVPVPAIKSIRIANVRDTSFTVSWVTDVAAIGAIRWGPDDGTTPANLAYDKRGASGTFTAHYATVSGLTPSTRYRFDVVSGATTDTNGGAHYLVTTGPTLNATAPDQAFGTVALRDGGVPTSVVVQVTANGPSGTSAPLAALVTGAEQGNWGANLGNLRTASLDAAFPITADTTLTVTADGGTDGTAGVTTTVANARAGTVALVLSDEATQALQAGWNLISLRATPATSTTASTVCGVLNAGTAGMAGTAVELDRWDGSGWVGHICGLPPNDFTLETGVGYFVRLTRPATWTYRGALVAAPSVLTLATGWNLVGASAISGTPSVASVTCSQINTTQAGTAVELDRWIDGGWEGYRCGLPVNDFTLQAGQGYFIRLTRPATWAPVGAASVSASSVKR